MSKPHLVMVGGIVHEFKDRDTARRWCIGLRKGGMPDKIRRLGNGAKTFKEWGERKRKIYNAAPVDWCFGTKGFFK